MRVKTKSILTGAAIVALIALAVLLAVFTDKPTAASAATSSKYTVMFDYELSYHARSSYGNNDYVASKATNVASADVLYYNNSKTNYTIAFSGNVVSASGVLQKGGLVTSDSITIEMTSKFKSGNIYVRNESGQNVASASGTSITVNGLSEGVYTVLLLHTYSNNSTYVNAWYAMEASFDFRYDSTAPTVTGASTSQTGVNTNSAFTVTASDAVSGVESLYMQTPNSSTYKSVGMSTTISKGSVNGQYKFYAIDKAKNKSQIHYVNFDDTPPVLTCFGAEFGKNTNKGFTVKAEDNSGSVTLYQKVERGSWRACGNSYTVGDSAEDSTYYFYAVDKFNNKTDEVWVWLGAELSGEFIKSDSDNSVYFTWDRPSWTATLDDKPYTKGAWIRTEGEHTIKLSSATKSAVYPYKIDHYYLESLEKPSCTHSGYVRYDCVQCGNSYTDYSIEETGHYYVASTTAATCTSGGYTVYTCTRCGDSYTDNYTNPLGHNYESTYMPASCTEYGKTVFTCQVCGSSYFETDGTLPTGHNYTNEVITAPTCTADGLRRSTCEICGDVFDTKITANGHNYTITESASTKGKVTRTYTCTVCGHSYKQELGDQYEEVTNYVEYLFEQYEPYMWWVLLASAGVWSIVIGVMIAIAQKNEDKEKARKMLINYVIGLVVIAVIVVACPFLIRGIAALVT